MILLEIAWDDGRCLKKKWWGSEWNMNRDIEKPVGEVRGSSMVCCTAPIEKLEAWK